jgi:MFS family permease
MLGGLFMGFLADQFGRKTVVLGSILIGAPAVVLAGWLITTILIANVSTLWGG